MLQQTSELIHQSMITETYADIEDLLREIGQENLGPFEVVRSLSCLELRLPFDVNYKRYQLMWVGDEEVWIYIDGSKIPMTNRQGVLDSLQKIQRHLRNYLRRLTRKGILQIVTIAA